jgi:hypothetical protein
MYHNVLLISIAFNKLSCEPQIGWLVGFMVLNVTFNSISVISWRSILLVEETGGPGKNHRPTASHRQTLSHNVVSSTPERESNPQHQW